MGPTWTRAGDVLRAHVDVHPTWRETAEAHLAHRLRELRALPDGLLHPVEAVLEGGELVLTFAPGALDAKPATLSAPRGWDDVALPVLTGMLRCHRARVAGLGPLVGARWAPPVDWFLPRPHAEDFDARRLADLRSATEWLARQERPRGAGPAFDATLTALREGDHQRLADLVSKEGVRAAERAEQSPPTPSFLTLLTEAELLERVSTLYRYRRLSRDEDVRGHGREVVLEVDKGWRDPHFENVRRPTPQEVWDELVEDSRATPRLAVSERLPNPLDGRLRGATVVRWLGTHVDQPLLYVEPGDEPIPAQGFIRLHLGGDNVLMKRKRRFADFAGRHPGLAPLLTAPPVRRLFARNPQPREQLEAAVLATRGVFAVQGPPGTGKTHLATQVVRRLFARNPHARVLVCAKEHFALDHILRKITSALEGDGVPVRAWRSVSAAKRRRGNVDTTWVGANVVRDLSTRAFTEEASGWSTWAARAAEPHDQRLASLGRRSANLFFATTTDAAMVDALGAASFDLVIVEEAGKCYPSELLHAVCLGRTVLMIGDQRQLPPYQEKRTRDAVDSWSRTLAKARTDEHHRGELRARFGPLFASLDALHEAVGPLGDTEKGWLRPFEFLFDRLPTRHRLEEQFRMAAPLSRLVGKVFYDRPFDHRKPELVAAGLLAARPLHDAVPAELDVPLLWIDMPHMTVVPEATEDPRKCGVRDNHMERDAVVAYLRRLRPSTNLDLVILTPYNAQKALLLDSRELRQACAALTRTPLEDLVRSTDEYQGREAELVVLSLVRNNSLGERAWGFMTEPERLNVMLSRARHRLVVVGCSAHVERHAEATPWLAKVWSAWREEARDPRDARVIPAKEVLRG